MFVDINGKPIGKYSIQSFHAKDEVVDGVTLYNIVYVLISGVMLIETFNSASDRDDKLNSLWYVFGYYINI